MMQETCIVCLRVVSLVARWLTLPEQLAVERVAHELDDRTVQRLGRPAKLETNDNESDYRHVHASIVIVVCL